MSLLTVKNLTHGFGDRAIFNDVSFRLLKGEHIGLDRCQRRRKVYIYEYHYRET